VDQPVAPSDLSESYLDLYALAKHPFGLASDTAPFLQFPSRRATFDAFVGALRQGRGHVLLVGETDLGKSFLLATALALELDESRKIFRIERSHPGPLTRPRLVAQVLGIAEPDRLTPELLGRAKSMLASHPHGAKAAVLAIDDAQCLTADALDWLARIAGGRSADMPQVVLVGRPELRKMLQQKHHRPFVDRISVSLDVAPLRSAELQQYIERRLWLAGSSTRRLLTRPALRTVIRKSDGRLGRVDTIMESALAVGYLRGDPQLTHRTVSAAAERLPGLRRPPVDSARIVLAIALIVLALGIVSFAYRAMVGS
jgi:general secretion pathway protein A